MNATQQTKNFIKQTFPSIWLQWHFMQRPKTAERELLFLDKIVPADTLTVDVGANRGLYTRQLARLSKQVLAFEPAPEMATLLRRTSAANVTVHEIALSDHNGDAELFTPTSEDGLVHGLASLEHQHESAGQRIVSSHVPTARLDTVVNQDVAFVKIDVEGHEMSVLNGAVGLIERCQPVFLVEAEDRHRPGATRSVFDFFANESYRGFYLKNDRVTPISEFRSETMQDPDALTPNGGRKEDRCYVNNFFFFPHDIDGETLLNS
ncbi:FkbM family methyltransferase [Tardiphaga sp.]|uniref:FkbM family methyltransferase n=1 Tax=Tardiphaga sp. TaxID=1926292 RepID=UPI00260256D5|nr:FkbM family methyltransferase [Tardiphaga sp.]MDB5616817.1 FkbM family methyltransferase [Tardiphaga sp.]